MPKWKGIIIIGRVWIGKGEKEKLIKDRIKHGNLCCIQTGRIIKLSWLVFLLGMKVIKRIKVLESIRNDNTQLH